MKRFTYLLIGLLAVTTMFTACSSSDDDNIERQEALYDVQYSDIIYTFEKGHNIAYYEYMHPQDSMIIYCFTDYRAADTTYVPDSYKEVFYPKTQKNNYYKFTYTFSNSSVDITFDNGKKETIRLKKDTPDRPIYSNKVYFNEKAFSPGASI